MSRFLVFLFTFSLLSLSVNVPSSLAAVAITITQSPSSAAIEEEFTVSFTATGLEISTQYYGKIRLGTGGTYTKGETKSGDTWLSDTASWTDFPTITSDSSGGLNSTLSGRAKRTTELGANELLIRLREAGASSNVSPDGEITITITQALTPTVTPTPTHSPTNVSTPTKSPTPTRTPTPIKSSTTSTSTSNKTEKEDSPTSVPTKKAVSTGGDVLSKESSSESPEIKLTIDEATEAEEASPSIAVAPAQSNSFVRLLLIGGGMLLIVFGIIIYLWKRKPQDWIVKEPT